MVDLSNRQDLYDAVRLTEIRPVFPKHNGYLAHDVRWTLYRTLRSGDRHWLATIVVNQMNGVKYE